MTRLLPALLLLLVGCDEVDPCTQLHDLGRTPEGLVLTPAEHPGWGRSECATCHPAATFHQADCMAGVTLDLEELGQLDANEPATCVSCHGGNGVPALEALVEPEDSGS